MPPGTAHRNPYNATAADLRLRHTASPGGAFAEAFVSSLSAITGFCNATGIPARLGAALGRRRGLRPGYE